MLTNFDNNKKKIQGFFCFPHLAIYKEKTNQIIGYFPFIFSKMNSSTCLKILDLKIYVQFLEMARYLRPP